MSALAAVVSRIASLSPPQSDMQQQQQQEQQHRASVIATQDASQSVAGPSKPSSAASCLSDSAVSSASESSLQENGLRRNEHLAVLLSKSLWKPDSQAARCDIFLCSRKFSLFERRHHCRKCGGVFCSDCSTRSTTLLDASSLPFLNPPRGTAIEQYATLENPVVAHRVCDDCWDQIHGSKISRTLLLQRRLEQAEQQQSPTSASWDSDSSAASSPRAPFTPLDSCSIASLPINTRNPLRRAHTSPRVPTYTPSSGSRSGRSTPSRCNSYTQTSAALDASSTSSSDSSVPSELDAYPLRHASAICKANGGGRWEPKPVVQWAGHRIPGTKAAFEIEMEREAEETRLRKLNPVYTDGVFQLRAPKEFEPRSLAGPFVLSTF